MTGMDLASEFNETQFNEITDIDFNNVTEFQSEGTTCDTYLVTLRQKRYFIKRLKPDLRDKEFNLAAIRKEFDIGSTLHHSSIPTYRSLGRDYIVIDYIEGKNLAQMMKDCDPWLLDKNNIDKLFKCLLDVTGYLHSLGIVHCDIKADNIIISTSTHNVMLVDFDKCHTSVMHSTSGNPALYGVDKKETGSEEIDIRALGILAENLRDTLSRFPVRQYRKFIKTAFRKGTDISGLRRTLDRKDLTPVAIAVLAVLIGVIILWILRIESRNGEENTLSEQMAVDLPVNQPPLQEKISPMPIKDEIPSAEDLEVSSPKAAKPKKEEVQPSPASPPNTAPATSEKTSVSVNEKTLSEPDEIIRNKFGEMQTYLIIGENALESSPRLQESALREKADLINRRFDEIYDETRKLLQKKYPERSASLINEMISASPFYKKVKRETDRILDSLEKAQKY